MFGLALSRASIQHNTMYSGKIFLILAFTCYGIQGQDYEGLEEVWVCTSDYNFEDTRYGEANRECFYSVTPAPHPFDEPLFPDLSCHPGFNLTEMRRMFYRAVEYYFVCGPNDLMEEMMGCGCTRFNSMYRESEFDYRLDLMDFERDLEGTDKCDEKYFECNRKYWFKDSSTRLNNMFGEELGGTLMQKIKEDCQPVLYRVFFEDGKLCSDPEAEEVYTCVNNAIGC